MDATAAAAKMLSDPDHFFKYYPVMMAGGIGTFTVNVANPQTYFLAKKSGAATGFKAGHFGATRPGFLHTKEISSFKMDIFPVPGSSAALQTDGVPMVNYNGTKDGKLDLQGNIAALDHYVVGAPANYMTTGVLTGCCFTWIESGADLWCTHIRPIGIANGNVLQTLVDATGQFAGAPAHQVKTFGSNDFTDLYGIVIGVRVAGVWKLYAQSSDDRYETLKKAWRLHPGPMVQL